MKNHIERLINILPEDVDAALITSPANMRYLTHFNSDDAGILLVTKKKAYFIIDSRYIEAAKRCENEHLEVILQNKILEQIKKLCIENNVKFVAIEKGNVTLSDFEKFSKELDGIIFADFNLSDALANLRAIKDSDEINKIITAQQITDNAFSYILGRIEEGRSEKELALELEVFIRKNGADNISFNIVFVSGKNSSLPHGVPTDKELCKGDFITIDFGADINGYKSDMTRTVALGSISSKQNEIYEIVLDAQESALKAIKTGKVCSDIDKIARNIIKNAGYGEFFGHALGHSVGLDIHESPSFSPLCAEILQPGMVLSVEPGIYIPENYGVRIEDLVVITEKGYKNLTKSNKSLIIL